MDQLKKSDILCSYLLNWGFIEPWLNRIHGGSTGQKNIIFTSGKNKISQIKTWSECGCVEGALRWPLMMPCLWIWAGLVHLLLTNGRCGIPGSSVVKNPPTNAGDMSYPQVRKIPWRRKWQPAPVFLPGKSLRQRILVGYSPWGRKRLRHDLAPKQQQ